jgi:DNA-binding response OmpR family regulator
MTALSTLPETSTPLPARAVLVVDRDERAGAMLGSYLEARGWRVSQVSDPRRVVRRRATESGLPPIVLLQLDEGDADGFELLGALAARTLAARVIVCATAWIDGLAPLGVERVLAAPCRFADLANALEDVRRGFAVRSVQ